MVVLVGLVLLLATVVAVRLRAGRSPEPPGSLDRWWLLPPVVGLVLCAPFLLWGGAALASYAFGGDDERDVALLVAGYVGLPSLLVAGLLATAVVLFRRRAWVSRVALRRRGAVPARPAHVGPRRRPRRA